MWGVLQLPPADYHAQALVRSFTGGFDIGHAVQPEAWVRAGQGQYEAVFNTTTYNQTEGFAALVKHVYEYGDITCCEALSGQPSISTTDTYMSGALILKYLADTYGEGIHARLVEEPRAVLCRVGGRARAGGGTLAEMHQGLINWLRDLYNAL